MKKNLCVGKRQGLFGEAFVEGVKNECSHFFIRFNLITGIDALWGLGRRQHDRG